MGSEGMFTLVFYETVAITLQIFSVLFNGAIIGTLWKKSLLQCPSNRFVLSLCLSHLSVSVLSIIISLIHPFVIGGGGPELMNKGGSFLSHVVLFSSFGVALGTSITVAFISIERYITIGRPMKYKRIVNCQRISAAIVLCWSASALITLFPIFFIGTDTMSSGSYAVPIGRLGTYFAIVFTFITGLTLAVMTFCYFHIFTIAKEKCLKVQIGQFSSPVSSISSDWPSSAYSSTDGNRIHSNQKNHHPNSLLHWVLMANVGRHAQPLKIPYVLSHMEDFKKTRFSIDGPKKRRRWKTFLQQNYNSPRKTVLTILLLVGCVVVTQVPLIVTLFSPFSAGPSFFFFCHKVLFSFSSVSNPILYGFLNRAIRVHLYKFLRIQSGRRKRAMLSNKNLPNSRKASISSGDIRFSPQITRRELPMVTNEEPKDLVVNDPLTIEKNGLIATRAQCPVHNNGIVRMVKDYESTAEEKETMIQVEIEGGNEGNEGEGAEVKGPLAPVANQVEDDKEEPPTDRIINSLPFDYDLQSSYSRKPSQDSGADVTFSEDEDEERMEVLRERSGADDSSEGQESSDEISSLPLSEKNSYKEANLRKLIRLTDEDFDDEDSIDI